MAIHERIKSRRAATGLSQGEVAKRVSELTPDDKPITRQTVAHWERGGSAPKRARLPAVAKVLQTTVEALVSGEPAETAGATAASLTVALLDSWRLQASSRSQQVIDNLILLAQKNELREDDWDLIEHMAARMRRR